MPAILLQVDNETSREYENFSLKTKLQFAHEISVLIKKVACDARSEKLNQLIRDINNDHNSIGFDSELLMKLIPID